MFVCKQTQIGRYYGCGGDNSGRRREVGGGGDENMTHYQDGREKEVWRRKWKEMVKKRNMRMIEGKKTEKRLGENGKGINLETVQRGEG